jgi:negative regulator of sigma E activity
MDTAIVHPRIHKLHPELADDDVIDAWNNVIHSRMRIEEDPYECIAVGMDSAGRLVEMVAVRSRDGHMLIFHAMVPPSRKTLIELNLLGGRRK